MIDQKLGNQFILDIKKYKYRQRIQRQRMKQVCKKYKHDVSYQHLDVWNNTFRISRRYTFNPIIPGVWRAFWPKAYRD